MFYYVCVAEDDSPPRGLRPLMGLGSWTCIAAGRRGRFPAKGIETRTCSPTSRLCAPVAEDDSPPRGLRRSTATSTPGRKSRVAEDDSPPRGLRPGIGLYRLLLIPAWSQRTIPRQGD